MRIVYQMLNDHSFVKPGYDDWVDRYVGVSQQQADHVASCYPETKGRWNVVPLGCDPELYSDRRVPGRVVYCSSPDRGLHWLLSVWPHIRAAVPNAHLRVFYHWTDDLLGVETGHPHLVEIAQRKRYIKHAMEALKLLGVEHVGSVSREQMAKEWSEASVLAYPCDTVAFSEGFSVSILEAHASYTMPVITDCDCLGEVYAASGCRMVSGPVRDHLHEFTSAVVSALNPRENVLGARAFAEKRTWAHTAKQLEALL